MSRPEPPTDSDGDEQELVAKLRSVRDEARRTETPHRTLPKGGDATQPADALAPEPASIVSAAATSPQRDDLNQLWRIATTPKSLLGTLLSPLRRLLIGSLIEQQEQMNSAQVRFDNEVVEYIDARVDRMAGHYDQVLGRHGKRMEEIDERHLILQQELIRHVHDLVERIEFVFESAETNHLHLDGILRETREELKEIAKKLETLTAP